MSIFEKATRQKIRFESTKGLLSVEDLYDLPLVGKGVNLDELAQGLYLKLKNSEGVSFVSPVVNKAGEDLQLKFDVVKHIIDVKLAERDAAQEAKSKAEKKQKLLGLLEDFENKALGMLSAEEIKAQLAAM